ncbi:hypothetical protein HC928_00470 [bacterium]|nr:hypothetical protein [bacterium]
MSDVENDLPSIIEYSEDVAEAEAPPPIPQTTYPAVIKDAQAKLSINKGTRYAEVMFHISADQLPADFPADIYPDGVTIAFRRISLEDNPVARYRMRKFCEAIGAPAGKRIDMSEWIGLEAVVDVGHEVYEGLARHVIKGVKEQ